MRYVTAVVGGLFIFVAVAALVAILAACILPHSWANAWFSLGRLSVNASSLIGIILGSLAGTHTFRASLRLKNKKN